MKATGSGLDATSESTDTRVAGVGLGSGGHKANLGHAGNNAEFDEGKPSVEKAPCGGAAARELLRGRSVLVTGATGFLGKVLVEKLIRCFSDVRRVFLLVRAGKGRLATERVKLEIINSPIFQTLERSWGREKVIERCEEILVAVNGDITLPRLGISDADFARMDMENVEIFFHCAASVNFDDLRLREGLRFGPWFMYLRHMWQQISKQARRFRRKSMRWILILKMSSKACEERCHHPQMGLA